MEQQSAGSSREPDDAGEGLQVGRRVAERRPATPSASAIVVRDGPDGLEVFMLERHIETDFAGGALVFPGGKLEAQDTGIDPSLTKGLAPDRLRAQVGARDDAEALGLVVSAVREAYEEAGVLFAVGPDGQPVDAATLRSDAFLTARRRLASRDDAYDWRPFLAQHGLVLDLGACVFFSWWVTPEGLHRRYDTRFFVAQVPASQAEVLRHDDVEMTSSLWLRPQDALEAGRDGRFTVIYPTRKNLEALAGYPSAGALLTAAAAGQTDRRRLQPVIVEVDGAPMVQHPDGGEPEPG